MTGKELILVLVGAGVAAAGGGVGAAVVLDGGNERNDDGEVLQAIADLRTSLDGTQKSIDEQSTELRRMGRRVQQFEIDLAETGRKLANGTLVAESAPGDARAAFDGVTTDGGGRVLREILTESGVRHGGIDIEAQVLDDAQKALSVAMENLGAKLAEGATQLDTLDGATDALRLSLGGLTKGLELRKLPEAERWEKARDDLGLTSVQIDEIKSAIDARDAAIKEAMNIEEEDDGDTLMRVRNLDFRKARDANAAYRKRVDNTLNDEQKKGWKEKGYDTAFGDSGMGISTGTVISVSSFDTVEKSVDEK